MDLTIPLLFGTLLVFLLLGIPIVFSIGMSALVVTLYAGYDPTFIVERMFAVFESFPLYAILLFVLMGTVLSNGGATRILVDAVESLVGNIRGGLGIVTVCSSAAFGTVTGSSTATVAAIGSVMLPEMRSRGYDGSFAAALCAASGPLGQMIPPSIGVIIYGVVCNVSIGALFLDLVIPGIILTIVLAVGVHIMARRTGLAGVTKKYSASERGRLCLRASPALIIPITVVYGIYGGVFTPTEAGAVCTVLGILLIGTIFRSPEKSLFTCLKDATMQGALIASMVMTIVAVSSTWAYFLSLEQIPTKIASTFISVSRNPVAIIMMLSVLVIILGTFMDGSAIIIMLAPVLNVLLPEVGINFLHFGIVLMLAIKIGQLTPPVGVCLYVAAALAKDLKFEAICKSVLPFILIDTAVLIFIILVPQIIIVQ